MESDDDDLLLLAVICRRSVARKRPNKRRMWLHNIIKLRSQLGEFHRLVQELKLDAARFQQYFRMSPTVFEDVVCMIGPHIHKLKTNFRSPLPDSERLAITLR